MTEGEYTKPADVNSGMIMRVLRDSPMEPLHSAVINPGFYPDYPACYTLVINNSDFGYFSEILLYHKLKLNFIKQDALGNYLYSIDEDKPIILRRQ